MPRILVMIPAYNEQDAILNTVRTLQRDYPQADHVVINDCSKDRTRDILRENGLNYLDLPMNLGIGGGVQTGYQYAMEHDYDIAIQFDGDGQHRADCIEALVAPVIAGEADMTVGSRFVSGTQEGFQSSAMRRLGIRIISTLIRLCTGKTVWDVTSGFRACSKPMIAFFAEHYAQDYPEPEAIVTALNHGFRVKEVPVTMNERQGGTSSIHSFKSVYYMIKVSLAVVLAGVQPRGKGGRKHV